VWLARVTQQLLAAKEIEIILRPFRLRPMADRVSFGNVSAAPGQSFGASS